MDLMINVFCPRHRRQVLLSPSRIVSIDGASHDLTVRWTCYCGHNGELRPHKAGAP